MITCRNCAASMPDTARVCGHCGTFLSPSGPDPAAAVPPPPVPLVPLDGVASATSHHRAGRSLWIALSVIVLAGAGFGAAVWLGDWQPWNDDVAAVTTAGPTTIAPTSTTAQPPSTVVTTTAPTSTVAATSTTTTSVATTTTTTSTTTTLPDIDLPDLVTEALVSPEVIGFTDFTSLPEDEWWHSPNGDCPGGVDACLDGWAVLGGAVGQTGAVRVEGRGTFGTNLHRTVPLEESRAVLVTFFYSAPEIPPDGDFDQDIEFFLEAGDWGTPAYRRFGIGLYAGPELKHTAWQGTENIAVDAFPGDFLDPGRPHALLLAVGPDGRLLIRIQEFGAGTDWPGTRTPMVWLADPITYLADPPDATWRGQGWRFVFQSSEGVTTVLMSFTILEFTELSAVFAALTG